MEKVYNAKSGYLFVFIELVLVILAVFSLVSKMIFLLLPVILLFIVIAIGFMVVNPNESAFLVLFGD
jgi:hypothetical protein